MKRFSVLVGFVALSAGILSAAAGPCPVADNLQDLIASFPTIGVACFNQDKLFWGFSYTPTGTNAPAASQVQSTLIFQTSPSIDIHGWSFSGDWEQASANLASFILSYRIQVCNDPACAGAVMPGTVISGADAIYAPSALTGAGNETVNWSNGASTTLTSSIPGPQPGGANIGFNGLGPLTVTANFSGTGAITGTSFRFYETVVPEPASVGSVFGGLALIAIAAYRRRRGTV